LFYGFLVADIPPFMHLSGSARAPFTRPALRCKSPPPSLASRLLHALHGRSGAESKHLCQFDEFDDGHPFRSSRRSSGFSRDVGRPPVASDRPVSVAQSEEVATPHGSATSVVSSSSPAPRFVSGTAVLRTASLHIIAVQNSLADADLGAPHPPPVPG
jgi:hypothetical protein